MQKHLYTRRRRGSPQHEGRMLPFGLESSSRLQEGRALPDAKWLMRRVSVDEVGFGRGALLKEKRAVPKRAAARASAEGVEGGEEVVVETGRLPLNGREGGRDEV